MNAHVQNKLKRFLRKDRKGGIEGLPLELMIIVVISTIGCGILVGWMGNISEPETIGSVECDMDQIVLTSDTKSSISLDFTVRDSSGDPIEGATVTLSGCGITKNSGLSTSTNSATPYATTGSNGHASFSGLSVYKSSPGVGYVTVTVSAGDHGETSMKIPVVR